MAKRITQYELDSKIAKAAERVRNSTAKAIAKLQADLQGKLDWAARSEKLKAGHRFCEALIREAGVGVAGNVLGTGASAYIRYLPNVFKDISNKDAYYGARRGVDNGFNAQETEFLLNPATTHAIECYFTATLRSQRVSDGITVHSADTSANAALFKEENEKRIADTLEAVLKSNDVSHVRIWGNRFLMQV